MSRDVIRCTGCKWMIIQGADGRWFRLLIGDLRKLGPRHVCNHGGPHTPPPAAIEHQEKAS